MTTGAAVTQVDRSRRVPARPWAWAPALVLTGCALLLVLATCAVLAADPQPRRQRIYIVSSYDRGYLWSQSTHAGLMAAMRRYDYLADQAEVDRFTQTDNLDTARVVLRKAWMDTKRRNSSTDPAETTLRIMRDLEAFGPDLVMLGDDNAAKYIGAQLLDTEVPVVFWGINGLPLKYGLVDSMDRPGHNVTGVWQPGYFREGLEYLKRLVPEARTFAILACDSETARPKVKQIQALAADGRLPLLLVETVQTNDFETFKRRTLDLAGRVDAFFVLNHDTLRDATGSHVDTLAVGRWYLEQVRKPEVSNEDQFVREGTLLTANNSGFNQGFMAFEMAYDVLEQGLNPGLMRTRAPERGPLMVNRERASMLGIDLAPLAPLIEEYVDAALALRPPAGVPGQP